jgi:hypothetical protein
MALLATRGMAPMRLPARRGVKKKQATVLMPTSKDSPPEKGQECHRMSGFSHKQSSSPA